MEAHFLLALCSLGVLAGALSPKSAMNIIPALPISAVNATEPICRNHSRMLEDALSKGVLWAQQMWDASAKSPVGILSGSVLQLGDFDECLEVKSPVKGKYCLVQVHLYTPPGHDFVSPLTLNYSPYLSYWDKINYRGSRSKQRLDRLKWALCVPASCGTDDLQSSLDNYISQIKMKDKLKVYVEDKACTVKDSPRYDFDLPDLLFSAVLILIFLVSITATVYDFIFFKGQGNSPPSNLLLCLSARRSYHSLFRRQNPISGVDLTPMYAIHFLSMMCVVLGHRYAVSLMGPTQNYELVEKIFRNPWIAMWIGHMDLFVDSFFVMSGFLLGLLLPMQLDVTSVNPLAVYVHRYLRLMPAFILVTFFYTTLFYKIGEGPLWNQLVGSDREACRQNWWTNLVFLSNVVNSEQLCVMHCWYLACDFQYMAVATIVILLLRKHVKVMIGLFAVFFCMTVSATFVHTYIYKRSALIWFFKSFFINPRGDEHYLSIYIQPQYRAGPYIMGVLTGYWVYRNIKLRLSKKQTWCALLIGCATMQLCFWSGSIYHNPTHPYNVIESSLFAASTTNIWAFGLCLVIVSVVLGTKTPGSVILSWKPFTFLGKLSYNIYLIHHVLQVYSVASRRTGNHFNFLNQVTESTYDVTLSIFLAFIMFMTIETPPRYISKQLLMRYQKSSSVSPAPAQK